MNGVTGTLRGGNNSQFVMQSLQELDAELTRDGISLAFCTMAKNALIEGLECKNHYYMAKTLKILLRCDFTGKLVNVKKARFGNFMDKLSRGCDGSLPAAALVVLLAGELIGQWKHAVCAANKNATQSEKEKQEKMRAQKKAKREQFEARVQHLWARFRSAARQLGITLYWQKEAKVGRPARVHAPAQPLPMQFSLQDLALCSEFTALNCAMFARALRQGIEFYNDYYVEEILKLMLRNDARKKLTNLNKAGVGRLVAGLATNKVPHRLGGQTGRARKTPFPDRVASVAVAVCEKWKDVAMQRKWEKKAPLRRRLALFRAAARQLDIVLYWQKVAKRVADEPPADELPAARKRDADELLFGLMRDAARVVRARVANEFGFS